MRAAFGPWGVGPEIGHYLLLLVTFFFNVNTGIRRNGWHDFGMPRLHYIDRIQLRCMKLFQFEPFPNHANQELFSPVEDFVAVGIGPLNYDDEYVHKIGEGETPDPNLSGELRFLAERMRLRGPPLDMGHPNEMKIFHDFMKEHAGKLSGKNLKFLSAIYKRKSDYKTIFPKLPSMLRRHYQTWKDSQEVVLAKESMKAPYYTLLRKLADPRLEIGLAD
jgi:hypothetical protein